MLIIGIAGASASGKTTLCNKLGYPTISHDNYYKDLPSGSNFDHPDSLDTELLIKHLKDLKNNKPIMSPIYDFKTSSRSLLIKPIKPTDIILVEGILLFHEQDLVDLLDIKIFIDIEPDICLLRRIKRDITERGRSFDFIENQYLTQTRPMYNQFVHPSRRHADICTNEPYESVKAYLAKKKYK